MDEARRKAIQERAYFRWLEAGCPEDQAVQHWLQAEAELGGRPEADDDEPLQRSVDAAVPAAEHLPRGADENPLSEQVGRIAKGRKTRPGTTTFEGGQKVER
jgi:hypothetical protein